MPGGGLAFGGGDGLKIPDVGEPVPLLLAGFICLLRWSTVLFVMLAWLLVALDNVELLLDGLCDGPCIGQKWNKNMTLIIQILLCIVYYCN